MKRIISILRRALARNNSPAFKTGLILLLVNPVIGWTGAPLAFAYYSLKDQAQRGAVIGSGIYVFSWILLGIGMLLAGKPGYRIARQVFSELRPGAGDGTRQ